MRLSVTVSAVLAGLLPVAAQAQYRACAIPSVLPPSQVEGPTADNPRRDIPIGGYTLALSWAPNYCHGKEGSAKDAFQCAAATPFGFTLHGLWPDGTGETWPQYCQPARPLPEPVIRAALCSTPSTQLIQHEWAKHGTCTGHSPRAYFTTSTRLYRTLRFPDMAALARREDLTAGAIANAFAAANRGIRPDAMRVTVTKSGWLDELWLCLDKQLRYATCRPGSGGAARGTKLRITDPG